jgi:hypothetical protein
MTEQHPITPSPSQLDRWEMIARATTDPCLLNDPAIRAGHFGVVHRKALRLAFAAGADQELEACCEWAKQFNYDDEYYQDKLRNARRPKPPSLKEQALEQLGCIQINLNKFGMGISTDTIRRALEALPND